MAEVPEVHGGGATSQQRVWSALKVEPDEAPQVLWGGAVFFALLAAISIGLNAADALFFLRFGVEALPWMIVFAGVSVMTATIGYAAGLARFGPRSWLWQVAAVFTVWLVVARLGVGLDMPGIYPVVWLSSQVIMYVAFTLLWDLAGELCDARQAKRLFPLFTSAGIAGAVTGNALTGPLAALVGTENLLVVEAVVLAGAAGLSVAVTRRFIRDGTADEVGVIANLREGLETTLHVPLFRLVAAAGAAMSVLFFLVFVPFSEAATAAFDSEESLAGFLGLFSSLATAATFIVSLILANRLFARIGVVAVLLVTALVYAAGFGVWLVSFGLVTATAFRGVQWVALNALGATAFSSLFNVVTGSKRSAVRDFVSAVPVQLGTVAAGLILLVGSGLSATVRTWISFGLALAFVAVVLPMRSAYGGALVDAVRHGLSDVFTAGTTGMQKLRADADTIRVLVTAAQSENPGRRKVAAVILGEIGGPAAIEALSRCLADAEESVRLAALDALAAAAPQQIETEIGTLLNDPSVELRRRALTHIRLTPTTSGPVVDALNDVDVVVQAHAARLVGGEKATAAVKAMLDSDDPEALTAALGAVAARPELASIDPVSLLTHPDHHVRAAAATLAAGREDAIDGLRARMDDTANAVRLAAADALVQSSAGRAIVEETMVGGSVRAREAGLQALIAVDDEREFLLDWARDELDRAYELRRFRLALDDSETASSSERYLGQVLQMREHMVERWIVNALSTSENRNALRLVARGAISQEAGVRAEALEAIESLTDRKMARELVSHLEDREQQSIGRHSALAAMASDHQSWIRALAARTLGEGIARDWEDLQSRSGDDASALVREAVPTGTFELSANGPMTTFAKVLALQTAPIFARLDPEDIAEVARIAEERVFEPNSTIYDEGSPGDELLVIVSGTVRIYREGVGGPELIVEHGPGEPVGELAVLRCKPRTAQVVAGQEPLVALALQGDGFRRLLEEQPELATAVLATLAERIAQGVEGSGS